MKKLAVITGGGTGIGAEVARRLLAKGHHVAILDKDQCALNEFVRHAPAAAILSTHKVDAQDYAGLQTTIDTLAQEHGRLDIVVNNVGGNTQRIPVETIEIDYFNDVVRLNLNTVFYGTRAATPHMRAQGFGRIVNLASIAGRTRTHFSNAAYTAAKAGVIGFTKQCSAELAPYGIAVNAVAHGAIATERILHAWAQRPVAENDAILKAIPAGRLGSIAEAAEAVVYLCSDRAGYTIGTVIDVNGGLYI